MGSLSIQARKSSSRVVGGASVNANDSNPVSSIGRLDVNLISGAMADERFAQGRFVAHPASLGVGLGGADDAIRFLALAVLLKPDGATHRDHARALGRLDQNVVLDDRLELI